MASQPDHIKQYTAQDFERYYAGQMTAQEMHALEKAALEDSFLADALEGYKLSATPVADMKDLKEKMGAAVEAGTSKAKPRRSRLLPVFRIAALFLLLAGAGWTIYYFTQPKDAAVAIQQEAERPVTRRTVASSPTLADSTLKAETLFQAPAVEKDAANAPAEQKKVPPRPRTQPPVAIEMADVRDDAALSRTAMAPASAEVQTFAADSFPGATPGVEVQSLTAQNTFKGRVVDEQNNPVSNASVMPLNSRTGTVTDMNGNFSLKTSDSTLTARVNAVGYEASLLRLNREQDSQKVVLRESQHALSEVVVTGYGKRTRKAAAKTNAEIGALEPREGWSNFNDYIAQNLRSPDRLGFKPSNGGEVRLTFDVNDKGEPVNIKVEKSLCEACDQEAIRLLKEGPKWKKKKGKKGEVVIRF